MRLMCHGSRCRNNRLRTVWILRPGECHSMTGGVHLSVTRRRTVGDPARRLKRVLLPAWQQ
jgi:hypothetical protein